MHESIVLYHTNSPSWCEMVKVSLPIEEYYRAHVRFEYRHCSSKSILKDIHQRRRKESQHVAVSM